MERRGELIRRAREARGLDYGELAMLLRSVARREGVRADDIDDVSVERWETMPYPLPHRMLRLLATALDIDITDLVGLTTPGERPQWLALEPGGARMVPKEETDRMLRRSFLRQVAALLAGSALGLDHERLLVAVSTFGRVDQTLLEDLRVQTSQYADEMWTTRPARLLPTLHGHLAILRRLVIGIQPPSVHDMLEVMAAETALVAGRLEWQLGQREAASDLWTLASTLAIDAGDGGLMAHATAMQRWKFSRLHASEGTQDSRVALELLGSAIKMTPPTRAYELAWMFTCRAAEHAAAGNASASEWDLDAAHAALSRAAGPARGYFGPWNGDTVEIDTIEGAAAMLLGRPKQAIDVLERSLKKAPYLHTTQRAGALADLAAAHAQGPSPDIDHACLLLTEAMTTAHQQGIAEKVTKAVRVRSAHLAPYYREPAVVQLDELISSIRTA